MRLNDAFSYLNNWNVLLLISLLLLIPVFTKSQTFTRLTQADGLPGNNAYCFLKDDRGFMWIGTTSGLCRFDGYEVKSYTQDLGYDISGDNINSLIQDADGIIWVGTNGGGLNRFDPKTEQFISFKHNPEDPTTIAGDRVRKLVEGVDGTIWVAFDNGSGLSKFNKNIGESINYDPFASIEIPGVKAIRGMVLDQYRPNILWLGTTSGLIKFDIEKEIFTVIEHPLTSINRHGLFALKQIDADRLLCGFFHAGIDIYNTSESQWEGKYSAPEEVIRIFEFAKNSSSEYWVAARKRGLAIYNIENNELRYVASNINHQQTPFPGFTYTVYNAADQLWVGNKHGVAYSNVDEPLFNFKPVEFSDPELGTITFMTGKYDKIYMTGVSLSHLLEIDKITGEVNTIPLHKDIIGIRALLELEDRIYFVNSSNEFLLFSKQTQHFSSLHVKDLKKHELDIGGLEIWTDEAAIILTRFGGAWELNLKTHEVSRIEKLSDLDEWQQDMLVHPNGELWICSNRGITIFNKELNTIRNHDLNVIESKNEKHVHTMAMDRSGVIWLGTTRGLVKLEGERETLYNVLNSDLPGNIVIDIEFDGDDYMWITTQKGVSKINTTSMAFVNYDQSDRLTLGGILKEINGEIFYGTYGGYFVLTNQPKRQNTELPKVYLTDFQVTNQEFPMETHIDFTQDITLNYRENNFSFSFTSPNYNVQTKLSYAYQLIGQDEDWVYTTDRRFATYTNLDGGTYTFKVKAKTREGDWGDVKTVNIKVATPYWESWWFYTLCSIVILGVIFIIYKIRVRVLQHRADLEAQELRLDALQKRLYELNATPPEMSLTIEEVNDKLNTPLSDREFEVLKLSLDGKTNSEIGEELFISTSTVKFHLRNTYGKLGVNNRKEALDYVVKTP